MEFKIKNIDGSSAGNHKVRESVFGIQPNLSVVRQAVLSELSNTRTGEVEFLSLNVKFLSSISEAISIRYFEKCITLFCDNFCV